ncbi:hypothetical protein [Burkholderia ubonensis]|nr:hypothetical protein [Burkholderia ubonensis]
MNEMLRDDIASFESSGDLLGGLSCIWCFVIKWHIGIWVVFCEFDD